jgi:hypothetical protein
VSARRLVAAAALVLLLSVVVLQAAACGTAADPFVGSWWEPTSGRRVDVKAAGDGYQVLFGSDLKPYPATLSGGVLRLTHPQLGAVELKKGSGDGLELVSGGTVSLLERAPQHQ